MSSWSGLLWMLLAVAALAWVVGNLIAVVAMPAVAWLSPRQARHYSWALVLLPWVLPVMSVTVMLLLSLAKSQGWIVDHCLAHQQHHPHFCLAHLPVIASNSPGRFIVALWGTLLLAAVAAAVLRQWHQHHKARMFKRFLPGRRVLANVMDLRPFAFTIGIGAPTIFISQGLKTLLSKRELRIVTAHEIAHIRHRDVVKTTVFEMLLAAHVRRAGLRRHWRFATEALADSRVTRRFDGLELAQVLVRLERAVTATVYPIAIAGADFSARVALLLRAPEHGKRLPWPALAWLVPVALPLVLAWQHHTVETLLGWWLHQ